MRLWILTLKYFYTVRVGLMVPLAVPVRLIALILRGTFPRPWGAVFRVILCNLKAERERSL